MKNLDEIERRILDYIETNDEYTDRYLEDCLAILKEVRVLREVAEAVKKDEARQPWFVVEALHKLDEARRG